jgi:hypothetical protein
VHDKESGCCIFFFKKKKKIKKTMSSNKALGVLASCCGFTLLAVGD